MTPSGKVIFGEWLPDQPFYENPGLVAATNAVPIDGGFTDYNALSSADDALGARPQGAFAALDSSGNVNIYAGDADTLYRKNGSSWDSTAASYATASDGWWSFAQFDSTIIATNFIDNPQKAAIGGVVFADLATSGTAPKAKYVWTIGRFVFLGHTDDGTNGVVPHRVQWSGYSRPTEWPTPNTSAAAAVQSGEQFLNRPDLGGISAGFGGDQFGIILQRLGVSRASYTSPPVVFSFDTIDDKHGAWFTNASIKVGGWVYFIASDGFYRTDGTHVEGIGAGKVDRTFIADCDQTYLERVRGAFDPITKCIFWCYANRTATDGVPNRLIAFNTTDGRWGGPIDDTMQLIFNSLSTGYTLDGLSSLYSSIDAMSIPLDSPFWQGGTPLLAGFSSDNKLGTFSGASKTAIFEPGEVELNPNGHYTVLGVKPLVTGSPTSITASLASRANQDNESRTFGSAVSRTTRTGLCDFRDDVQFASVRLTVEGGFEQARGLTFIGKPAGYA